jgi:hypothetical protein
MARSQNKRLGNGAPTCNIVGLDNGNVAIQFSEDLREMVFTPEQAKALGVGFIEMATRSEYVRQTVVHSTLSAMPKRTM